MTCPVLSFVPAAVELLGGEAELDDEVVGQVFRLDFAALLPPQAEQRGFVIAHDDPGIRAADEVRRSQETSLDYLTLRPPVLRVTSSRLRGRCTVVGTLYTMLHKNDTMSTLIWTMYQ